LTFDCETILQDTWDNDKWWTPKVSTTYGLKVIAIHVVIGTIHWSYGVIKSFRWKNSEAVTWHDERFSWFDFFHTYYRFPGNNKVQGQVSRSSIKVIHDLWPCAHLSSLYNFPFLSFDDLRNSSKIGRIYGHPSVLNVFEQNIAEFRRKYTNDFHPTFIWYHYSFWD
jgi:hypothetical protein